MTACVLSFYASDISAVGRSLSTELADCDHRPGHVDLLNMLARAVGSRNFHHFRAQVIAEKRLTRASETPVPVDYVALQRLSRYFDANSRLIRWPTKFSHQEPCLWALWSKLPPRKTVSEREMNQLLLANHR